MNKLSINIYIYIYIYIYNIYTQTHKNYSIIACVCPFAHLYQIHFFNYDMHSVFSLAQNKTFIVLCKTLKNTDHI